MRLYQPMCSKPHSAQLAHRTILFRTSALAAALQTRLQRRLQAPSRPCICPQRGALVSSGSCGSNSHAAAAAAAASTIGGEARMLFQGLLSLRWHIVQCSSEARALALQSAGHRDEQPGHPAGCLRR